MLNKLYLDLNNFKPNLGSIERGDSIELNIKLLDDEDYSRSKFRVLGAKADGKYVEQIEGINLEEKDLKIVLEDQFVNCEGIVKLELNVVSSEIEITTKEFYFFVSNTMNAEIIDSVDSIKTLEKVSKYVDDAVNNLDSLKEASEDITIINSEFKENEIKRKANELLRERSEKERVRLESIRTTEEADRIKAEVERKEAENNRKVAESNRKLAENTRKTNEAARVEAELNRQSLFEENEEIRNENENLRIEAEKERKLAFSNNNKFESERVEAEKLRAIAEDKRVTAEKARSNAEEERIKAETRRENTYTDFNDSEVERKNNEANRVRAEAERVNAESGRNELFNTNEEKRNSTFIESERTRERAFNEAKSNRNEAFEESERVREEAFKVSEAARNEAEEGRVAAELLRVEAEKLRVAGEENRNNTFTQSEEERKGIFEEAENARKATESKRVKAENSRVEAEKLRVSAETGRVEAENLRATAEEERVAAETKREEGFNKFDGKINANTKELKNARTATTGEEFNSLDERIDCEVDRLNKKIEVSFLQQEDKENHTIENTVDGMTTDMVVKGRTLQNLMPSNSNGYELNLMSFDNETGVFTSTRPNGYLNFWDINNPLWKQSTQYTIILEILENTLTVRDGVANIPAIVFGGDSNNSIFKVGEKWEINILNKTGVFTHTFTTRDNFSELVSNKGIRGFVRDSFSSGQIKLRVMAIEGALESIPNYFRDIKSFGELEQNKISILSHNYNLYDLEKAKKISANNVTFNKDGSVEFYQGGERFIIGNDFIPNTQYTVTFTGISGQCKFNFHYTDGSDEPFGFLGEVEATSNINKTLKEIRSSWTTGEKSTVNKIQVIKGNQKLPYISAKQNKKDILLQNLGFDEGLRGFDVTSCDELNSINNKAIKKIEKYIVTGDEDWQRETNGNYFFLIGSGHKALSKTLNNKYQDKNCVNLEENGVWSGNAYKFCIKDLSVTTVEEFKTKLKQFKSEGIPLEIYYELSESIETPLDENINLKTFNEKTYVSFENSISGTSSFKAPVNVAATISRLNRENRALEEENLKLKENMIETSKSLIEVDTNIIATNWEIDFRVCEVEWTLEDMGVESPVNLKIKKGVGNMALSRYEQAKIMILGGVYEKETLTRQLDAYLKRKYVSQEEYDELIALMEARDMVTNQ
ncbi:TPA: hypothetical protein K8N32_000418 [Clostridium perfringens]|nr:hypothetical protein [Clostridium perfringens]HBI7037521.1 hypothetical protein [Clostridium perfringens]